MSHFSFGTNLLLVRIAPIVPRERVIHSTIHLSPHTQKLFSFPQVLGLTSDQVDIGLLWRGMTC